MSIFTEFVIVGYRTNEQESRQFVNVETEILDYYNNQQPEGGKIPNYLQNINIMCYTTQFDIRKELEYQRKLDDINTRNYLHQFIMTDQDGCIRYCTSLVLYERQSHDLYIPYAYCIVSQESNLIKQKCFMTALYNGIFDQLTRYRDSGWSSLCKQRLMNQQLIEFYLSVGSSDVNGLYYIPKQQIRGNKQEIVNDLMIDSPQRRYNLFNQDICFKLLLSRLSLASIIKLVQCIIMEKQIILFTESVWDLANITEALLALIYPFQWRCIYIPYLPSQIIDTLHASVPYIIGVHLDQKEKVITQIDCLDKVLVDLDQDRVIGVNLAQPFPDQSIEILQRECSLLKQSCLLDTATLLKLQTIFIRFNLQLINNILPYFTYSEVDDHFTNISEIFAINSYIEMFTPIEQEFYREFVNRTMIFPRFIEDIYKLIYSTEFLKVKMNTHSNLTLLIELLKLASHQRIGHFNLLKKHHQQLDQKFKILIQESSKLDTQNEQSIHILFPQYLDKIENKQFKQQQFPIIKLDRSKLINICNTKIVGHQSNKSTQLYNHNGLIDENNQINNIRSIIAIKIQDYYHSSNQESTILWRYPNNHKQGKRQSLKQMLVTARNQADSIMLPTIIGISNSMTPIKTDNDYSARSTKRIFNIDSTGYVSMFRTKTHNGTLKQYQSNIR